MLRRGVMSGAGAFLLTACSLLTPTDGLSGGAFPAPSSDGGSDGGSDGSGPDSDAGSPEGAAGGDGASTTPCAQSHAFCDDFDRGSYDPGWTVQNGPGVLSVTSETSTSSPFSLLGVVAGPPADIVGRFLSHTFTTNGSQTLTCAFDFRKDTVRPQALKVAALTVASQKNAQGLAYGVYIEPGKGFVSQFVEATASGSSVEAPALGFPDREWHRLTLVAGVAGVRLLLDGVQIATSPYATAITPAFFTFNLGIVQLNELSAEWRVRFDNVVCDITP